MGWGTGRPLPFHPRTTLITGASSGIGRAAATALAARGSNLVVVARRRDRLEALAQELRSAYGVHVQVIPADLRHPHVGVALLAACENHVDAVINNAGIGMFGRLDLQEPALLEDLLNVNVRAVTSITRAFIPAMRERREGTIVNISSIVAHHATPYWATYAASKAFVLEFTKALWQENLETGVRCVALCPGQTSTEFFTQAGRSPSRMLSMSTPQDVVDAMMAMLDSRNTRPQRFVDLRSRLTTIALDWLPLPLRLRLISGMAQHTHH
ncbi:CMP/dCMP deaminase zinc-binding [Platysternon megacephalum]|uniref:CMP/dCMP deaminase zinc-binding n=1 Tax=Platysternon megacephalum TaxID=55544 RepID=A0A4D9DGC8_9SAUR|nr:CMP/dCMP deaminase zinc-binding [Platysternon megacephalum]